MPQKPRRRTPESPPASPSPAPSAAGPLRVHVEEDVTYPALDDSGLALDESQPALADLWRQEGDDPYQPPPEPAAMSELPPAVPRPEPASELTPATGADDACDVSPRTILEAMLFVGHPQNEPLATEHVSRLMRGVTPGEIDELVRELNDEYGADGAPYMIEMVGCGYRMALRPEFAGLHANFSGKVREARLSQAAIDLLAVVAYQQPITRAEVERVRGRPVGALLNQLVRRDLLAVERAPPPERAVRYRTTERFLQFFHLSSLDDLPRSQDLERNL